MTHSDTQHQTNQTSSRAIATLKALEYLLKLVVRSCQLVFSQAPLPPPPTAPSNPHMLVTAKPITNVTTCTNRIAAMKADAQFQTDLLEVFSALNELMRLQGKTYPKATYQIQHPTHPVFNPSLLSFQYKPLNLPQSIYH